MKPDTLQQSNYFIDISTELCPMTFVKTKLLIERMKIGETAEVRLQGIEPLDNVPRSIIDHGHEILLLEAENKGGPEFGVHRLILRKCQ